MMQLYVDQSEHRSVHLDGARPQRVVTFEELQEE